jgi:hypothetical protein
VNGVVWYSLNHNYISEKKTTSCEPAKCGVSTVSYTSSKITKWKAVPWAECKMDYKYRCIGSVTTHSQSPGNPYADWKGNNGKYNGWADICPTGTCPCDVNDYVSRYDQGTLTSKTYGIAAFPPHSFRHGDKTAPSEQGYLTLGPLKCRL